MSAATTTWPAQGRDTTPSHKPLRVTQHCPTARIELRAHLQEPPAIAVADASRRAVPPLARSHKY